MMVMQYLEISLVEHCNLNCKSCSHFSPVAEEEYINNEELERDLERVAVLFKGKLKMLRLMGGEPLLHPNIEKILDVARQCFPKTHIQLVTNGLLLPKLGDPFFRCCSENKIDIHITVYPLEKVYKEILTFLDNKQVSYSIASNSINKEKTFHHLVIDSNGGHDKYNNFLELCSCSRCTNLSKGKIYLCPVRASIRHLINYFKLDIPLFVEDGYDIHEADASADDIISFISAPTPFCEYCYCEKIEYNQKWEHSTRNIMEWT